MRSRSTKIEPKVLLVSLDVQLQNQKCLLDLTEAYVHRLDRASHYKVLVSRTPGISFLGRA